MLFRLIRDGRSTAFRRFIKRSAVELGLAEKDLENWMSRNPTLLFGGEEVLVIAQSISGQRMADILALDTEGNLVIVEIKRDWSDRQTVGQLLEYAAEMAQRQYEDLEELHRQYWSNNFSEQPYVCLLDRFRELVDDGSISIQDIPKRPRGHRICIVAPDSDHGLRRIIEWLREYGVPISFAPFAIYESADEEFPDILLEIDQIPRLEGTSVFVSEKWRGDWFFNTNETHAPGAYKKMFDQNIVAIYGYESGSENLQGSSAGQQIFAYANEKGILAYGRIVDGTVHPGHTIFGENQEYHMKVQWETIVADDKGVTNREVREQFQYGLPVRNVFCGLSRHTIANWVADELRKRSTD